MSTVNLNTPAAYSYQEYLRLLRTHRGPIRIEFSVAEVLAAQRGGPGVAGPRRVADPGAPPRRAARTSAASRPDPLAALEAEVDALERRVRGRDPSPLPPGWEPTRSER